MLQDIFEVVNFIKDNAVTKQELQQELSSFRTEINQEFSNFRTEVNQELSSFRTEVNQEFKKVREEIIEHVDAFVGLHKDLESELAAVAHKTDRLERNDIKIGRHLQLQLD